MTTTDKDTIAKAQRHIAALLSRTMERGCTESEATEAASKAADLMAKYGLEGLEDAAAINRAECVMSETAMYTYASGLFHAYFAIPIAQLCDCKAWHNKGLGKVTYYGFKQDAELASYLYSVITGTLERYFAAYKKTDDYDLLRRWQSAQAIKKSYLLGMTTSILQRLPSIMRAKQEAQRATTGTDLVVVKAVRVQEEFNALGIRLVSGRAPKVRVAQGSAYRSGVMDGERVAIRPAIA